MALGYRTDQAAEPLREEDESRRNNLDEIRGKNKAEDREEVLLTSTCVLPSPAVILSIL
jgi:hypothetical protein